MSVLITPGIASPGTLTVPPIGAAAITARSASGETAVPLSPVSEPPLLDQAADLANRGRFDDALAACERHLRVKGFSPPAYYLMGMICQAAGNRAAPKTAFTKQCTLIPCMTKHSWHWRVWLSVVVTMMWPRASVVAPSDPWPCRGSE